MKTLEVQIDQLAQIASTRLQGTLSSDSEMNQVQHVKVITVRSEKRPEEDIPPKGI